MNLILDDVAKFITSKVDISEIDETNYISTENMLPNKGGVGLASSLPDTKFVRKYLPKDILISNIRPYFKKIWFANKEGGCSNDVFVLRANEKYDPRFLYYVLSSDDFFKYVMANAKGTKMPRGDKKAMLNYRVPDFSIENQQKISLFLSKIDKRIEINDKINNILEDLLKNIFFQWFINFKDYNGTFKDSELGKIPVNWEILELNDLVEVIDNRGKTPPLVENNFDYPIIDVKALNGGNRIINFDNCSKYVDKNTYKNWFRSGHPQDFDILISTVGSICELKLFLGSKGCLAQNVVAFRSKDKYSLYLYQYLKYIKRDLEAYNIGSVQPSIKVTHILKHNILIPNDAILDSFNHLSLNITKLIYNNSIEIQRLINLRENLLPKLMSNEIDISKIHSI